MIRIRRKSVRNSIESFEDRWWRDNIRASSGRRLLPDDLDTVQRHLDDTKNRLGGCDVDESLSLLVVRFALKLQKEYLEAKQCNADSPTATTLVTAPKIREKVVDAFSISMESEYGNESRSVAQAGGCAGGLVASRWF
jgi:hypothetical protein